MRDPDEGIEMSLCVKQTTGSKDERQLFFLGQTVLETHGPLSRYKRLPLGRSIQQRPSSSRSSPMSFAGLEEIIDQGNRL